MEKLSCDYLVIGCGATAMAFLDELVLGQNTDLKVVVVDRRAKPGGHWVDAYDFVRLHQPAANYGCNSRSLGGGGADLASKYQILAYYELVMADLLATGRVQYYPLCDYKKEGRIVSLVEEGLEYQVEVRKKTVDATWMETQVPSTSTPKYEVGEGVNFIPINGLARLKKSWSTYMVLGAGKTGLDALLFLLDQNISPDRIHWIVSNDCWYWVRDRFVDKSGFFGMLKDQYKGVMDASSIEEIYKNYGKLNIFMKFDEGKEATKFRAATVSKAEMVKLRQITNVIRQGRVEKVTAEQIVFQNGSILPTTRDTLHIDCTAPGTLFHPCKTIFPDKESICLQMVQIPAPTYSGAVIAAMEVMYGDDLEKLNDVCTPLSAPHELRDWFKDWKTHILTAPKIGKALGFRWLLRSRLSGVHMFGWMEFIKLVLFTGQNDERVVEHLDKILTND